MLYNYSSYTTKQALLQMLINEIGVLTEVPDSSPGIVVQKNEDKAKDTVFCWAIYQ